jgi:hypothetical protein
MRHRGNSSRTTLIGAMVAVLTACGSGAGAGEIYWDDFFAHYGRRIEGVTPGAGNAKEVNAAIHVIDPWPRRARNRHIPGNGERMVGAVERYRDVSKLPLAPQPIAPTAIGTSGVSSSTGAAVPTGGSGGK